MRSLHICRNALMLQTSAALATALVPMVSPAHAQDSGPIIVTGQGLDQTPATPAYGQQMIGADELAQAASGRLEDALQSIASFQQFRRSDSRSANPSAQGATLRALGGNATSRTLILLDGVPMADPFFGYVPFTALVPENLSSARITRGGGAGAFGSGAVAGTIELTSAVPGENSRVRANALFNQRGESSVSASLAPRLGSGRIEISGRRDAGDGFWTTPASQRVPASVMARNNSWTTSLRSVVPVGESAELQTRVAAFDDHRTLRFAGANTRSQGIDASLRVVSRGRWQVDALAYVQARDFSNVVVSATSFKRTLNQRATPSTGFGGKIEVRPPLGRSHILRVGADWRVASGHADEEAISPATGRVTARRRAGGRNDDLGLYIEDDWSLGALVLTGGLRMDRWSLRQGLFTETTPAGTVTNLTRFADRSGWAASLRGGALWKLAPGIALRAAAYSALRQPTLNELYRPFVVFPVTTRANADLRNERLAGYEIGADWQPDAAVKLSLTAFDNRLRHAIANVTIAPNLRQRMNVRAIAARGIEADARATLGTVTLSASLACTRSRVDADGPALALNAMRPAQTPRWAASGRIAWQPSAGWTMAVSAHHTGGQYEDDLQTDLLPPATTIDAWFEAPLGKGIGLVLRGENLLDEKVVTRNQAGSIDLGAPRTLWAGVRLALP